MADKERRMSDRSLENLKLGAQARYQGKVRHNFTILPETSDWLKQGGNASAQIDDLVRAAKSGELIPSYTHDGNNDNSLTSEGVYERIDSLEAENEQLRSLLKEAQDQIDSLKGETDKLWTERQQKREMLKELLEKVNTRQKGYLSNSFGQGIRDLRDLA